MNNSLEYMLADALNDVKKQKNTTLKSNYVGFAAGMAAGFCALGHVTTDEYEEYLLAIKQALLADSETRPETPPQTSLH